MRAVVQRVHEASVTVENEIVGRIKEGLLVYAGVGQDDDEQDVRWLTDKITQLRIFNDDDGKMNHNVADIQGGILIISAFAVQGDARKGRRPSFDAAAGPERAEELYDKLCDALVESGLTVARGVFRAHMDVTSTNDGPICILLDSKRVF